LQRLGHRDGKYREGSDERPPPVSDSKYGDSVNKENTGEELTINGIVITEKTW
jgi:hypothetical protein